MFTLAISSYLLPLSICPNIPGSYAILIFTALDLASITSTSTAGYCFFFGSTPSFFLELFLHWSPVAYWVPTDLRSFSFSMGQPKMGGSWWKDLTECGPLEKGMANHFSILALRTPWTVWNHTWDPRKPNLLPKAFFRSTLKRVSYGKVQDMGSWVQDSQAGIFSTVHFVPCGN